MDGPVGATVTIPPSLPTRGIMPTPALPGLAVADVGVAVAGAGKAPTKGSPRARLPMEARLAVLAVLALVA